MQNIFPGLNVLIEEINPIKFKYNLNIPSYKRCKKVFKLLVPKHCFVEHKSPEKSIYSQHFMLKVAFSPINGGPGCF